MEATVNQTESLDFTPRPSFTRSDNELTNARYRDILQRKIDDGARRAAQVIATVQNDPPRDQILRMRAAAFAIAPSTGVQVRVGDDWYTPTDYALGQIAARAGVPLPYLRELASPQGQTWQHQLASEILRQHYGNAGESRVLVRSVRGQMRGWLSDKYRRLDSRPLIDALADEAQRIGAVPVDGVATETRIALKVIVPQILEPVPGEYVVFGGEWSNSDYGNGVHAFRTYALRVVCLNGMTAENLLKQVHLGARLSEEIEFSDRTHRLDTAASVSALRDVVRGALSPAARDRMTETIRAANDCTMNKGQLSTATRTLPKHVQKSVIDAFESPDVINLPEGDTAWRASNAISWVARNTEDAELRIDLERAAGALV